MAGSKRAARPASLTAGLAWFHRWLGIATCLIFAMWFASGAVLLFKPFPSLSQTDRIALARTIDLASLRVAPGRAMELAGRSATSLRLVQRGTAPAYIVGTSRGTVAVDAVSGDLLDPLAPEAASAPAPAIDYDQWIVHNQFDPYRPLFRIPLGDAGGTVLYTSAVTGETVQRTTFADRAWNWAGAVLHWVYFTPLRSSFTAWDQTVWWLSLVATLVAIAGTILGVIRTATALKQSKPSLSFYRVKWMRWHHILGLFAAIFVVGWIVSGWLSMDHGRLFSRGQASEFQTSAYQGRPLADALADTEASVLAGLGPAREIDFSIVGREPVLTLYRPDGSVDRLDGAGRALDDDGFRARVAAGVTAAWPGAMLAGIDSVSPSEMYALAEGWPAAALRVTLTGGRFPDVYVDGRNGRILTVMDKSRAAYAWVYYALHTFNFPGLTARPLLRQILVLIPLLLGFAFSITGVVIGWQRLRKSI